MSEHFAREVKELKQKVLGLSSIVETQVKNAVSAITDGNRDLAQAVRNTDGEVDRLEVEVEEECLKIMALYQPVAVDLRFIVAVLKINNDLERIGDLACNIAKRAEQILGQPEAPAPIDYTRMGELAQKMLKQSLDALVNSDADLAKQVMDMDDEIDNLNREAYNKIKSEIRQRPERLDFLIYHLGVSRQLERIGDHATNIAEDVIYMATGEIVRHPQS